MIMFDRKPVIKFGCKRNIKLHVGFKYYMCGLTCDVMNYAAWSHDVGKTHTYLLTFLQGIYQ